MSNLLRDVMLDAASAVIGATPVDTGHAASNWILSTGHPYMLIDGSRLDVSTSAQDEGIAKIRDYDVGRDGPIYLRNNVLYLQFLDKGSSPQAEANFVADSFVSATASAPRGSKTRVRKMLRRMAREAYRRGI
jgi:hypothetical protein